MLNLKPLAAVCSPRVSHAQNVQEEPKETRILRTHAAWYLQWNQYSKEPETLLTAVRGASRANCSLSWADLLTSFSEKQYSFSVITKNCCCDD